MGVREGSSAKHLVIVHDVELVNVCHTASNTSSYAVQRRARHCTLYHDSVEVDCRARQRTLYYRVDASIEYRPASKYKDCQ